LHLLHGIPIAAVNVVESVNLARSSPTVQRLAHGGTGMIIENLPNRLRGDGLELFRCHDCTSQTRIEVSALCAGNVNAFLRTLEIGDLGFAVFHGVLPFESLGGVIAFR
jgi:hypothetical protein